MKHSAFAKRDSNHDDVRGWYEQLFCSVLDLHEVGFGCPDFLIGCAGRNEFAEAKSEGGKLAPSQLTFARDWRGGKVAVIRDQGDVVAHVQSMRKRQAGLE